MSDFVGVFVVHEIVNYRLNPTNLGVPPGPGIPASAGVERVMGLRAVLEDASPTYPIGREAMIFLSNRPSANLAHSVVAFNDGDDVSAFVTVSEDFMDKLEMLLIHKDMKGITMHISGPLAPTTHPDERKDGVFAIKNFDFCWNGPGSGRAKKK